MGKEAAPGPMNPTSWRNCLENRVGSRIVVPKAAKWGPSRTDRPLPAAKEARLKGLRLFSKQFRKVNSAKFICRIVHISLLRGARMASKASHAACEGSTCCGAG